jgi:hypothetical protein
MPFEETKIAKSRITPRYSWNTAKVGFKHQSINQSKPRIAIGRVSTWVTCWYELEWTLVQNKP